MELTETIERINSQLVNLFGIDTITGQPIWRVVFSDDQYEMRETEYTDAGIRLLRPEVRLLPKYKQWIHSKYILERLVIVPETNLKELAGSKISYEVIWVFADKNDNYLPPRVDAAKFIIDTIYAAQYGTRKKGSSLTEKYLDEDKTQGDSLANKDKRVDAMIEELFGEQSSLGGSTKTGETVIVPRNFEKVN